MPWANFEHLTGSDTESFNAGGAGKARGDAEQRGDYPMPLPLETEAGGEDTATTAEITDFLNRERRAVHRHKFDPDLRMQPWFNRAAKSSEGRMDDFVAQVIEQLERGTNEQSLLAAQDCLNEAARTAEGTAAVRKHLSKATLLRLFPAAKGRT